MDPNDHLKMLFYWRWRYGPAYRAIVAESAANRALPEIKHDLWIEAATEYCRQHGGLIREEVSTTPVNSIAAAILINRTAQLRDTLMVLVLADIPPNEISELLTIDQSALEAWERLFFCCREYLTAKGWITNTAIYSAEKRGNLELAAKMRIALGGGPVVAKALVAGGDDFSEELHRTLIHMKACLKLNEAWDAAVRSPQAAVATMRLHYQMIVEEGKRAKHKSELAAAADRRVHEETMRRLAVERARALETAAALKLEAARLAIKDNVLTDQSALATGIVPASVVAHRPAA